MLRPYNQKRRALGSGRPAGYARTAQIEMKKQLMAIAVTSVLLAACGGGKTSSTAPAQDEKAKTVTEAAQRLVDSKSLPDLDHSTDVAGTDADNNGVRDDIDRFIAGLPDSANQKAALHQLAANLQASLTVDPTNKEAARAVAQKGSRALGCITYLYGNANNANYEWITTMEKYTANTPERFKAYMAFNAALSGMSFHLIRGADSCDNKESAQ